MEQVPDDILCLIFESTHDIGYYSQSSDTADGRHQGTPEATLSQVCTIWRDMVYSLPRLWATFRFRGAASVDGGFVGECERLRLYLARSIDRDLDLVFNFVGVLQETPVLTDMLHLVTPHLHRLWRFILYSDPINFVVPFHKELTGVAVPRLEHFEVCTGRYHNIEEEGYDGKPHWDPKILTHGPPNIKFLKLDSSASGRFRPPFNNLVHFSLHPGLAPIKLQLLWVCFEQVISLPFIETISIWGFVLAPPDPGRHLRTIEAKRLKHFRIGNTNNNLSPLLYLLQHVAAPALESLTIQEDVLGLPIHELEEKEGTEPSLQFPCLKSLYFIDVYVPRYLRDSMRSFWEALYAKSATITHLSVSYITEILTLALSVPDISLWGTVLSDEEGGVRQIPKDKGQMPWQNLQLLDVNHNDDVAQAFGRSMAHLRPLGLWPNLSTIRTPFGCLPPSSEVENVPVESLGQVLPDWPPNYPFSSRIPTDEFPCRLISTDVV